MKKARIGFILLIIFLAAAAGPAAAEIRFELGFGWTVVGPRLSTTYTNEYAPPLVPLANYVSSSASQTLQIKGKTTYGMNGFFNLFITENFGLQILADYHRPGLKGTSSPYEILLNYTAFEPGVYQRTDNEWPDTQGNFTETTFSLNGLARFPVASNLSFSLSAGASIFYLEGKGSALGYTGFTMDFDGEVYTLTGKTYKMVYEFGPRSRYGFNVGTEVAYTAFRNVIFAIDIRWFQCAKTDFPLHIVDKEGVITEPLEEIEAAINLGSLRLDPSYFRAGLAIRFQF